MSDNDSSSRVHAETKDQDTSDVLPLGPLMKATMIEWYEYGVRLSEPDHVNPSQAIDLTIAVALADIMAENRVAKFYREVGVSAFGYISVSRLPDVVPWVRIAGEQRIKLRPGDFGPGNCFLPVCDAVLAEFFRDIREVKPELESIHSLPLPPWMEICRKRRAECTGRLPDMTEDPIH